MMGVSGGGLFSCYVAWTRPDQVSQAACLSAGFGAPFVIDEQGMRNGEDFLHKNLEPELGENAKMRPYQEIYLDVGDAEDDGPMQVSAMDLT